MRMLRSALALSSVLVLGLASCSTSGGSKNSSDSPSSPVSAAPSVSSSNSANVPKGDGSKTIYLVSKGFQHRFWQAVKQGAEQAGKEFNYKIEFVGPDNEQATQQQLDQLKTALAQKPAAIGFAALDSGSAEPVLEEIQQAGIPMVAFDSGVDSTIPKTTVSTDNKAAAGVAAKHMSELLGGKGTVGMVCHDQTSATGKQRCEGFQEWMKTNAPDIKLLEPQYAGEVGLAANTSKALITANSDINGIYGSNEATAIGALQGVNESGKKLTLVGFDSGKAQIDAIKAGTEAGAITQAPVKMGYETVIAGIKAANGMELPPTIDSGYSWFDKDNMTDPAIAQSLYE
ncbi:ABC transporter substrate-binding protein [Arachnia rubra]|uniref:ABC transporter substrate-binding protein n=1 Tax=Arachnia rubra TaxID=1547448 RepID=A0ABX7Y372_9ACTN|nr:ABC transporter substrate-binding protein [Arachnia rubra]MBB1570246.1 ABC transporter substrate-binding protein [Propionibacterium sp.]MDO4644739.1 ABC transporter substrate-binding protein [Propionibacteriaceae bacterium]MBB1575764.1 ABC transporter substrate-binding protein [Propionibacterium sp.]QUC07339.1 ABC transporter substrate-binding protein [Arachnia rubra]BCR81612.1 LacI family transcriptional regulator [Arachnia rubra]